MLKDYKLGGDRRPKEECRADLKQCRQELAALQLGLKEARLPVIVLVEGWGAAGKGSLIRSLIRELDPRFYRVLPMTEPTAEEGRWPFLKRHFAAIPEAGKLLFLDSGWLEETVQARLRGDLDHGAYARRVDSLMAFQRQLAAGGYLWVKIFLHIDKSSQRKRLEKLAGDRDTAWRAGEEDWRQNRAYDKVLAAYDDLLERTGAPWAPWQVIDGTSAPRAQLAAAEYLCQRVAAALKQRRPAPEPRERLWPLVPMPALGDIPLDRSLDRDSYEIELKKCRKKLARLHNALYRRKLPVVIVFEGWDAAGKGGAIKRLAAALDPRGYEVLPIAAPSPEEAARHYLWRFWTRLPKTGHIAVFDRSWYGRVMVERVEGFCPPEAWRRAYDEINQFEHELTDAGTVVIKFWLQIDPDTQLARFQERQNDPEKRWKLTDEDWRNREKWPLYETAVNEMLARTSTRNAPWEIVEARDKHYARIKVLKTVIRRLEQALD